MKVEQWIGILAVLALPAVVRAQELNLSATYAGEAVALQTIPWNGDATVWADTGPAPPLGGQGQSSVPDVGSVAGLAGRQLYAVTLGAAGKNRSQASLTFLDSTLGSHRVTALWVEAEATASADFFNVPTAGQCALGGLTVDGQLVKVTGEPNQTIEFPDGFLIINEQTGSNSPHFGSLTVNALHFQVDGVGSVIAASAKAEIINAPTRNLGP